MADYKTLSFRGQLRGELGQFLNKLGMERVETTAALVELVVDLAHYEEEGTRLFPKVIFCHDLPLLRALFQGGDSILIGTGPASAATARQAIKRCAPLARNGWLVYIELSGGEFRYGVLREAVSPIAIGVRATLNGLDVTAPPALLIAQVAPLAVEIVGTADRKMVVHVSAVPDDGPSPSAAFEGLIGHIVREVPPEDQEPLRSYLVSALGRAIVQGHGTLIAVVPVGADPPADLVGDGLWLQPEVALAELVRAYRAHDGVAEMASLSAYDSLIEGMLSSDGLTVFRADGTLLGYNFFVKVPAAANSKPSELIGGARRRAFVRLTEMAKEGSVACAFIRSSSGATEHVVRAEVVK